MEIAITGEYGDFAAGYAYSDEQVTSEGMNPSVTYDQSKLIRANWRYEQREMHCDINASFTPVPMGVYRWDPVRWTGGNDKIDVGDNWGCNLEWSETIAAPIWTARETVVNYGGWYSIGPVKL